MNSIDSKALEMYKQGISITKIAKQLQIDRGCLSNRLKIAGIVIDKNNNRKYYSDETFFNEINTEEKAYWLGFLMADGNLHSSARNDYRIELGLSYIDKNHIHKFLNSLQSNYPIFKRIVKLQGKNYESCRVLIYSKMLHQALVNLGCTENKTFSMKMPKIRIDLYRHFIRGFFDGDGSISNMNKNPKTLQIHISSGCKEFLNELSEFIQNEIGIELKLRNTHTCYELYLYNQDRVNTFLDYMYKDTSIFLDRKYNRYCSYKTCRLRPNLTEDLR